MRLRGGRDASAYLVGAAHAGVEDVARDGDERRVRDPGAVVAVAHLALLVRLHLFW